MEEEEMKKRIMVCLFLLMIIIGVQDVYAASPTADNTFYGYQAGDSITTGLYNSFFGAYAGFLSTGGKTTPSLEILQDTTTLQEAIIRLWEV
jgi:hypothetical protein